jgi:hypothetical protein
MEQSRWAQGVAFFAVVVFFVVAVPALAGFLAALVWSCFEAGWTTIA